MLQGGGAERASNGFMVHTTGIVSAASMPGGLPAFHAAPPSRAQHGASVGAKVLITDGRYTNDNIYMFFPVPSGADEQRMCTMAMNAPVSVDNIDAADEHLAKVHAENLEYDGGNAYNRTMSALRAVAEGEEWTSMPALRPLHGNRRH